jgi:hypothetical protein
MSKQTQQVLKMIAGETVRTEARKAAGRAVAKAVAKRGARITSRAVGRTAASPWLLTADVAEIAVDKGARSLGARPETARRCAKGAGLATSIGVGAAVGGPVGAAAGAGLWAVGEVVGWLFE